MSDELKALYPVKAYEPIHRPRTLERRIVERLVEVLSSMLGGVHGDDPLQTNDAVAGVILTPVTPSFKAITEYDMPVLTARVDVGHERMATPADYASMQVRNDMLMPAHEWVSEHPEASWRHLATFFAEGVDSYNVRDLAVSYTESLARAFAVFASGTQAIEVTVTDTGELWSVRSTIDVGRRDYVYDPNLVGISREDEAFAERPRFDQVRRLDRFWSAAPSKAERMAPTMD